MAEGVRVNAMRVTLRHQLDQPSSAESPVVPGDPYQVILEHPTTAPASE